MKWKKKEIVHMIDLLFSVYHQMGIPLHDL